ncbi:uncharacterized protein PFL1_01194 [Pseudozyma flocculosa PF-1]|uniref:uncharacterized protein n=1 Tax=Pseudozyma flocculosa PF-1 TaxID=1277687 RepID=UPI000456146A|nr:uncharacterized protein PFL1_01194 [Pseudozyma flocculosa PF-1]EPQ31005.1 hypothetical protein PFL1_01194 [Pseudozyma flocculosa PF-1]
MTGMGAYSLAEAYKMGAFRRGPLPSGAKARPVWGASLVVFGIGCIGAGVIRLGIHGAPWWRRRWCWRWLHG